MCSKFKQADAEHVSSVVALLFLLAVLVPVTHCSVVHWVMWERQLDNCARIRRVGAGSLVDFGAPGLFPQTLGLSL